MILTICISMVLKRNRGLSLDIGSRYERAKRKVPYFDIILLDRNFGGGSKPTPRQCGGHLQPVGVNPPTNRTLLAANVCRLCRRHWRLAELLHCWHGVTALSALHWAIETSRLSDHWQTTITVIKAKEDYTKHYKGGVTRGVLYAIDTWAMWWWVVMGRCQYLKSLSGFTVFLRYFKSRFGRPIWYLVLVFQNIAASVWLKVKAGWPSCWQTFPLVYHRHPTSAWILCGRLVPRSVEVSDRVDWGNPETSSAHRPSHYSIYALLGGTPLCSTRFFSCLV